MLSWLIENDSLPGFRQGPALARDGGSHCGRTGTSWSVPGLGMAGCFFLEPVADPVFMAYTGFSRPLKALAVGWVLCLKPQQRWMIRAFWRNLGIIRGFDFDPEQIFSYAERTS